MVDEKDNGKAKAKEGNQTTDSKKAAVKKGTSYCHIGSPSITYGPLYRCTGGL